MPTKEDLIFAAGALKRRLVSQLQAHQVARQIEAFEKRNVRRVMPELMIANGFISARDARMILDEMGMKVFICPRCASQGYLPRGDTTQKPACSVCQAAETPAPAETARAEREIESAGAPPSPVGREIPPYRILKPMRSMAFGHIYRAEDMESRRTVELQLIEPVELASSRKPLNQALKTLEAAKQLQHQTIARIWGAGRLGEYYYTACEITAGWSLRQIMEQRGSLDADQAMVICAAALEALECAREREIINWNITPDSLLIAGSGHVKLAPFGILAEALKPPAPGEPREVEFYRAPELWEGKKADIRADLYSLGLVICQALTGIRPFEAKDVESLSAMHCGLPAPDPRISQPSIPAGAAGLVNRMCAADPEHRFPTPAKALNALKKLWKNGILHPVSLAGIAPEE